MPKFKIHFADSLPGEPGTGGPDNDFYAAFDYTGTRADAEEEAKRISFEKYHGDFKWWITPETRLDIYVKGIEKSKIERMNALMSKYPFLEKIVEQQTYPLFDIEEAVVDGPILAEKCHDHGSEGPEAFDEQVYSVSGDKIRKLAIAKDPSPSIREELSSQGITIDFLVKERHLKYEIEGEHHHDVSLTVYRA